MAELIDREPIIKRVKNFAEYEWNDTRKRAYMEFLDMLIDAPTVTEAEIRNKAIDDTMRKLYELGHLHSRYLKSDIDEIADQLKEE